MTAVHSAKVRTSGRITYQQQIFLPILYFEEMNIDPKDPKKADRDRFVLSKGHTAPGLYSALAERGYFPKEDLKTLASYRFLSSGTSGYEAYSGC